MSRPGVVKIYRILWGDGLTYIGVTTSTLGERLAAHRRARPGVERAGRYSREVGDRLRRGEPYMLSEIGQRPTMREALVAEEEAIKMVAPEQRANLPGRAGAVAEERAG